MDDQKHRDTIKCMVIGDSTVGKTCMLMRFKDKAFDPDYYVPTVFENYMMDYMYESIHYKLSLHDTAGNEGYDGLRPLSYSDTHVFLWLPEVKHHSPHTPIVLVGTKLDLRKEKTRFVPKTGDPSIMAHVECSALSGERVEEVFQTAVRVALEGMAPKPTKKKTCLLF